MSQKNLIYKDGLYSSLKTHHAKVYFNFMNLLTNHLDYPEDVKDVVDVSIQKNVIKFLMCRISNLIIQLITFLQMLHK